jgi:hypothetical protein
MPDIALQRRTSRFFDLQEQRIVGGGKKECDEAAAPDASYPDNLYL